ncbi:MAG: hypothetical protein ACD_80C00011G0010 [uncultured bacterium (gcode 4)]|uniref:Uncharacterized protein n=1 Tax=uncultured bacterium (gcode 4) TaxID=1234023 RepID=K1XZ94_9BACT|nr:MAG: hypothetical protein ACD_80C00011G0010 [uncultured bacterium (gcode 4)]
MITLSFWVNLLWIEYFRSKFNKTFDLDVCSADAKIACNELIFLWDSVSSDINFIIEQFFWEIHYDLKVEVYPKYFLLWAINIEKWLIVLWQPKRSDFFYWWLLLHELIHFVLKDRWLNRFIEETICFLFERMFILKYDWATIDDFQYDKWTDDFHTYAIMYSKVFFDDFMLFYAKSDINWLINFLNKKIDNSKKEITIENNLIAYLSKNA